MIDDSGALQPVATQLLGTILSLRSTPIVGASILRARAGLYKTDFILHDESASQLARNSQDL
jgi:hypothetical protein